MPATQVTEGVHRLTQGVVNFYLVEEGGRLLLVDAGAPGDWDLLVGAVAALGRRLDDLEAVLLTHAHADHIGTAERARATAGAPVWVHQEDAAMARSGKATRTDGSVRTYLLRAEFYRTLFSLARRGATRIVPVRELATFADGETLELPGRPRAVHAPGHSPGSAALLLEGHRVLLGRRRAGDQEPADRPGRPCRSCRRASTATPRRRCGRWPPWTGSAPTCLLPGHGEPWTGGMTEALRRARAAGPS